MHNEIVCSIIKVPTRIFHKNKCSTSGGDSTSEKEFLLLQGVDIPKGDGVRIRGGDIGSEESSG